MSETSTTPTLRQDLQAVLGQLFELHVQAVEAHAHFIGTRFTGMQQQLEGVVETARRAAGTVADVVRGFDRDGIRRLVLTDIPPVVPGLRPGERCATAAVNMITHRIAVLITTIRSVCDSLDDTEPSIADLLRDVGQNVDMHTPLLASESRRINYRSE
ncbi:hypothetical protein A5724_20465 [Mycobacterium sp. ACS1612]|uniref:hypothetical protein n=1 Tax=Mycobacterium sp. ACS1612 TaxID=1834117 RepID=UPI0007FDDD7A|nr:hypothetical protein [Mycobacterium sp. ACS1612]OBF33001.1 hypothetical protein A5724_20465 [Mycobacterium sp. ACS1612]